MDWFDPYSASMSRNYAEDPYAPGWTTPTPNFLFHDPYAEARSFYPPWVFERLLAQQMEAVAERHRKAEAISSCRLVDDVGHQLRM